MTVGPAEMAREADLTAVWLPHGGRSPGTKVGSLTGNEKPILGRAVEAEGKDLVLFPAVPDDPTAALRMAAAIEVDGAESVPYWRRYHPEVGQLERFNQAPYLFTVRVFAPPRWQQPLKDWLDQEHFEHQRTMDGVFYSEGYEPLEGPFHFFNLWAIEHPDVVDSPEWIRVRASSWYEDVIPGFQASVVHREVYRILESAS